MNSCFEIILDFKGIMSDGLNRIVTSKNNVFLIPSKLLKRMLFHQIIEILR